MMNLAKSAALATILTVGLAVPAKAEVISDPYGQIAVGTSGESVSAELLAVSTTGQAGGALVGASVTGTSTDNTVSVSGNTADGSAVAVGVTGDAHASDWTSGGVLCFTVVGDCRGGAVGVSVLGSAG